jgi:uncharacterized protein YyaL (SSP411 family)
LIDLYESGASERYLHAADALCARMLTDFRDEEGGGFFQTAHQHEALIARPRDGQDDALPNANAVAAILCARLSYHFDRPALREVAQRTVECFGQIMQRAPRAFPSMLAVVDLLREGPVEVALVGPPGPERDLLAHALGGIYLPNRCLAHAGAGGSQLPLLRDKQPPPEVAQAYVCRNFACHAPTRDPEALASQLRSGLTSGPSSA